MKNPLVSQSDVYIGFGPVFNKSHQECSSSCALDGEVRNGHAKPECASDRETTGKIVFCSLLPQ